MPWPFVTDRQLAELFSVTARTVRRWVSEEGLPVEAQNRYNLKNAVPWCIRREVKRLLPDDPKKDDYLNAATSEKQEKAKILEMKRREREGELIEAEKVERETLERIYAVKTALNLLSLVISRRLAGVDDPIAIENIIEEEAETVMERFASRDEQSEAGLLLTEKIASVVSPAVTTLERQPFTVAIIKKILGSDPWNPMQEAMESDES